MGGTTSSTLRPIGGIERVFLFIMDQINPTYISNSIRSSGVFGVIQKWLQKQANSRINDHDPVTSELARQIIKYTKDSEVPLKDLAPFCIQINKELWAVLKPRLKGETLVSSLEIRETDYSKPNMIYGEGLTLKSALFREIQIQGPERNG